MKTTYVSPKHYIGSSADDSIGIGTLLISPDYKKTEDGHELKSKEGEWIQCYDVWQITSNSSFEEM